MADAVKHKTINSLKGMVQKVAHELTGLTIGGAAATRFGYHEKNVRKTEESLLSSHLILRTQCSWVKSGMVQL